MGVSWQKAPPCHGTHPHTRAHTHAHTHTRKKKVSPTSIKNKSSRSSRNIYTIKKWEGQKQNTIVFLTSIKTPPLCSARTADSQRRLQNMAGSASKYSCCFRCECRLPLPKVVQITRTFYPPFFFFVNTRVIRCSKQHTCKINNERIISVSVPATERIAAFAPAP